MGGKGDARSVMDGALAWNHFQLGASDFDDDHLPSLLDVLPVGVCVADAGLIAYGNRAASALLQRRVKSGSKLEAFVERHQIFRAGTSELYPADHLPIARAASGVPCHAEDLEVRRDGHAVRFAMRAAPLCDRTGAVQLTVATLHPCGMDGAPGLAPSASSSVSGVNPIWRDGTPSEPALRAARPSGATPSRAPFESAVPHAASSAPPEAVESVAPGSEIRASRNLEAIGELAAGVAHEINTPIQYIGDNTAFLDVAVRRLLELATSFERLLAACREEQGPSGDLLEECERDIRQRRLAFMRTQAPIAIEQTLEGIAQVRSIVRALKEFSHPGEDDAVPVDVNRLVHMASTITRNAWRYVAELSLDLCEDLPTVTGYPQELGQVLINLIVNAAHAVEERHVGGAEPRLGKIAVRTRADGPDVRIEVSDDGCGIPEAVRGRIMDPFFTTKPAGKGTGQGLSLAHRVIVERHRGLLSFETEVGVGTTFQIFLPGRGDE